MQRVQKNKESLLINRFYCKTLAQSDIDELLKKSEKKLFTGKEIDKFLFDDAVEANENDNYITTGVFYKGTKILVGFFTLHVDVRLIDFNSDMDVTNCDNKYIYENNIDYDFLRVMTVDYLGVRQNLHRKGIGSYILMKIKRISSRTSIDVIQLNSLENSVSFYKDHNFEEVEEIANNKYSAVRMLTKVDHLLDSEKVESKWQVLHSFFFKIIYQYKKI